MDDLRGSGSASCLLPQGCSVLDAAALEQPLVYRTIAGEAQETPVGLVVIHMINHATHHRGQVHCMLSQIPTDPPPLDLIYFLREKD